MKYLFELTKDYKAIPKDEVLACLKTEEINYSIIASNDDVVIVETEDNVEKIKQVSDRVVCVFFIDDFLFSCQSDPKEINRFAFGHPISKEGSIAIRCKNRSNKIKSEPIIKALGKIYSKGRNVDLENPDIEVRALITNSETYVGIKIYEINRKAFNLRKAQFRPFFSPISLDPKLARALVNLSLIKKGEVLLDPFCGTGGILLEAGLIGAKVIGNDIEDKMISGCKKTLDYYKITNYDLICSDVGEITKFVDNVDAVVTDFPYGKSATTKGEDTNLLYSRAFKAISKVLKKKGRAVLGLSKPEIISHKKENLSLLNIYNIRVHKSLTRYFAVYEKQP